ncbi:MAG: class I SAM-dependent RNA methyltransferase [Planctomycetota bacterium]|jgi:23S rRNA (uracil1939-C5)-methyltransferase
MARVKPPFRLDEEIVLEPTGLGARGAALGEYEGWRVRVYGGIPGEQARVRITHVSRGGPVAEARFLAPAGDPHPARRDVPCPIHDTCGGCGLQHASEDAMFAAKVEAARAHLPIDARWEEPIRSPRGFEYRAKTFLLPQRAPSRLRFGARPPRGPHLVDTTGCAVLRPELEAACAVVRRVLAPRVDLADVLRSVLIRSNRRGKVCVTLVHRGPAEDMRTAAEALPFGRLFLQRHDAPGNRICSDEEEVAVRGTRLLTETYQGGVETFVPPTAFMQANLEVAADLYRHAAELLSGESLAEIYCGSGVAGLLALRDRPEARLRGIDRSPRSIAHARANAEHNGLLDRCVFEAKAAEDIEDVGWDAVLVNPPRAGCHESVLEAVRKSGARRMVYLSCNPATLARDADRLGWPLVSIRAADMLPQTTHLELLALFER